jgi:hypothetical protein
MQLAELVKRNTILPDEVYEFTMMETFIIQ